MALAEAGLPRGQEPNPARRAHPEPDSGQPRLGCAASLGATLEGASLGATLEGASLGATRESASLGVSWCWARRFLPKRSCPASVTELLDPAECATRELEAGELAALRVGDADRDGLRGRTRRCEAARSAVHSAAALLRAPAELAPADAAESVALHNVFAFLLRRLGADPRP